MGQAKLRAKEIEFMKSHSQSIPVIAVRHLKDGQMEITAFRTVAHKPVNDKGALLQEICCKMWGHKPPVECIFDYLLQTLSYKTAKEMGMKNPGFKINFFEPGADKDIPPQNHSCREIQIFDEASYQLVLQTTLDMAKSVGLDVKMHC